MGTYNKEYLDRKYIGQEHLRPKVNPAKQVSPWSILIWSLIIAGITVAACG